MPAVPQSNLVAVNNLSGNVPESPAQTGLVIGPTQSGTANSIIRDDSINTVISEFGGGPGSEYAGTALSEVGHGVLYQIKSATSTNGTVSSVTKTEGATLGADVNAYGAILVPGADANGDVLFVGKQAGAELEIVVGMATATLVTGLHVKLTVTAATTGTQQAALVTGVPAALALFSATALGTGASICGQTLATTSETAGRIVLNALQSGISYENIITGPHPHTRVVSLVGGNTIHVEPDTNAAGEPTTTAVVLQSDLVTLAANNPGVFVSALAGSGAGIAGPKANTALPFGSTGAMTVSGLPYDAYDVTIQIVTGGGLGAATFRVSLGKAAGIPLYDGNTYLIPAGGSVVIPQTGLTVTFTGSFDANDEFAFTTTAPASTLGDVAAALTYFLTRPEQASLIAIAGQIPVVQLPAWIASMQVFADQLENAKKYCRILLEYEGPAVAVSNATWAAQVSAILAPLAAPRVSVFGGSENLPSSLPLPQLGRFEVVNGNRSLFARALALPSQVMPDDQTLSGRMSGVIAAYQTDVAGTLASARSSYLYLLTSIPGVQADGLLLDAPTGDFTYLTYGRVLDEGMYYGYLLQTPFLNTAQQRNVDGTIAGKAARAIEKTLTQRLIDLMVKPGKVQAVQVVVDRTNTDARLKITYYFQILFYVKRIDGRAGITRTISGTQILG
jgi:hypothetical protein